MKKKALLTALATTLLVCLPNSPVRAGIPMACNNFQTPSGGYVQGLPSWTIGEQAFVLKEYNRWKSIYVVSAGTDASGNPMLRVQRDAGSNSPYDTVSEGIGYGMLLAAWMGDETTFDGLDRYRMAHVNKNGLMHWRVDASGNNIDEFALPVYVNKDPRDSRTLTNAWTGLTYSTGWWPIQRSLTSAADADLDMAAAMYLKYLNTPPSWKAYGYQSSAQDLVQKVWANDIYQETNSSGSGNGYYVANGCGDWGGPGSDRWGGSSCWNPSYTTFAYFQMFANFDTVNGAKWLNLYDDSMKRFSEMNWGAGYGGGICSGYGLFPDFVDSSAGNGSYIQPHGFLTATVDPNDPANTGPGVNDKQSDRGKSSFNFYYDAVRTPWRLALEQSWHSPRNPDSPYIVASEVDATNWVSPGSVPLSLYYFRDGYAVNGSDWDLNAGDWNNTTANAYDANGALNNVNALGEYIARGGANIHSTTFMSMMATPYLANNPNSMEAYTAYNYIKNYWDDPNGTYHYFGNTLRMLSLVYMSGNAKDFSQVNWVARPQVEVGMWTARTTASDSQNLYLLFFGNWGSDWISAPYVARYFINLDEISDPAILEGIAEGTSTAVTPAVWYDSTGGCATISSLKTYDRPTNLYYVDVTFNPTASGLNPSIPPYGNAVMVGFSLTVDGSIPLSALSDNYSDQYGALPADWEWHPNQNMPVYGSDYILWGTEPVVAP